MLLEEINGGTATDGGTCGESGGGVLVKEEVESMHRKKLYHLSLIIVILDSLRVKTNLDIL